MNNDVILHFQTLCYYFGTKSFLPKDAPLKLSREYMKLILGTREKMCVLSKNLKKPVKIDFFRKNSIFGQNEIILKTQKTSLKRWINPPYI